MTEEKITGLFVERKQFTLDKVMMNNKTKVCKVWCTLDLSNTSEVITFKVQGITPSYQATQQLQDAIARLQPYLVQIHHVKQDNQVVAVGLELNGTADNATWKIHGINKSDSEQNMPIATHKVHYEGGVYVFENDILELIEIIESLIFEYVFAGAKAQLTLFDEDDENTEVEEAEEVDENEE